MSIKEELKAVIPPLVVKSAFAAFLVNSLPRTELLEGRLLVSGAIGALHFPLMRALVDIGYSTETKGESILGSLFLGANAFIIPELIQSPVISPGLKLAAIGVLAITEVSSLLAMRQLEKGQYNRLKG